MSNGKKTFKGDEPGFEKGDPIEDLFVSDPVSPIYDPVTTEPLDPSFSFTGSDFNLKYEKLIPFLGVFLIYKFLFK